MAPVTSSVVQATAAEGGQRRESRQNPSCLGHNTTGRSDEDVAAFRDLLHVLLVRWPPRPWHSPATATGRVHLPSSPRICSGGAVANVDLGLDADAHAEVKLESGSGQSERGGNIVIVEVVEKVYLISPTGVGVGNWGWGWGWVVGLFHRTIHLLNRKSTNSEAKLVQAGSQASVLLLARSTTTTTAAKPRGSTVKMATYVEPQTTTDKNESAVSVDYDALDDSPIGHLAKKQRTTPSPTTPSTHHSLGRPLPQPAPFGEVRYYQDEYEETKTKTSSAVTNCAQGDPIAGPDNKADHEAKSKGEPSISADIFRFNCRTSCFFDLHSRNGPGVPHEQQLWSPIKTALPPRRMSYSVVPSFQSVLIYQNPVIGLSSVVHQPLADFEKLKALPRRRANPLGSLEAHRQVPSNQVLPAFLNRFASRSASTPPFKEPFRATSVQSTPHATLRRRHCLDKNGWLTSPSPMPPRCRWNSPKPRVEPFGPSKTTGLRPAMLHIVEFAGHEPPPLASATASLRPIGATGHHDCARWQCSDSGKTAAYLIPIISTSRLVKTTGCFADETDNFWAISTF
ncbi:uncharacterized protein B0T23DRAFT_420988 [Neurospora hispaniola]|uniref:Uncharacterized protein n=1 Tax=Neurospora hispaniola TaxID=588809 RepID=A0AAJ0I5P3_9PEZI|nr:hypothetical protein B0T23DRAFT_420988 [Neurospora hispaniola]